MRRSKLALIGTILCAGMLTACEREAHSAAPKESAEKKVGLPFGADQSLEDAQHLIESKKEEYRKALDSKLAALDSRIRELKDRSARSGAQAQGETEKLVKSLSEKRKALEQKLGQWKMVGVETWQSFTFQLEQAVEDLDRSLEQALSKEK